MERITMLGTGAALVTKIYNTCFTLSDDASGEHFLVDGGGGNGILRQLELAGISELNIHHAFISHNHSDHILGLVWMVRAISQHIIKNRYAGNFVIYGHPKSLDAIQTISRLVMKPQLTVSTFGTRILFRPVADGDSLDILGRRTTFFDLHSTKELQHGFTCSLLSGKKLSFLGDEPFNEEDRRYVENSDLLMQEAYCLYSERDKFHPYEKHHGTVLDSCRNAASLNAKATLLFHTEARTPIEERRDRYVAEGQTVFAGPVYVPRDLEVITL